MKLILTIMLIFLACDNKVDETPEEHAEISGFKIKRNDIVYVHQAANTTLLKDSLVIVNNSATTQFKIELLDDKNQVFEPDEAGLTLKFLDLDTLLVKFENKSGYHDGKNHFEFNLNPLKKATNTTVFFQILHNDHPDFTSLKFQLKVN